MKQSERNGTKGAIIGGANGGGIIIGSRFRFHFQFGVMEVFS